LAFIQAGGGLVVERRRPGLLYGLEEGVNVRFEISSREFGVPN
jgi:hypothetical protein